MNAALLAMRQNGELARIEGCLLVLIHYLRAWRFSLTPKVSENQSSIISFS